MKRLITLFAIVQIAVFAMPKAEAEPATLTLTVSGIETQTGNLMIVVQDEAQFAADGAVASAVVPASAASVTTTFEGLEPGHYAIRLFHDVNSDGEMSSNPFGMPTEPFAFSNDAVVRFGPPKWADAAFEVTADGASQSITLQ